MEADTQTNCIDPGIISMMSSLLLSITYGVEPKSVSHPWIVLAEDTINIAVIGAAPGAFIVDTFPICEWATFLRTSL